MNRKKKTSLIIVIIEIIALLIAGFFVYKVVDKRINEHKQEKKEVSKTAGDKWNLSQEERNSWNLILVNPSNAIPEDYPVETVEAERGFEVDTRIHDALIQMLEDCRSAGFSPLLIAGFRSHDAQERIYNRTDDKSSVALPYHSEHEVGLAVDIVDASSSALNDEQANTPAQQWLMQHCQDYGFILRYPKDKQDITGITYEPWHYRYVGIEHAKRIMENGICLEEYLK